VWIFPSCRLTEIERTDGLPLRGLAYDLACLSGQNTAAISANLSINRHASMSLSRRECPAREGDESGTVRHLTLSRSDTRVRVDVEERNLFCIRLHFVLEERIGVEKISAERFLTIDEAACRHVFAGRNLRRRNPGRQDFATTANTMTISCSIAADVRPKPHQAARFSLLFSEKHSRIWMRSSSAAGPSTFLSWFQSLITSRCFSTVMSHLPRNSKRAIPKDDGS